MEECPDHWEGETLDARQGHILPGFIDAHCHLGMFGDALGFEADDGNEATDPCTPHLRAIDAVNPLDRCFEEARQAGVTTVLTGPGSANPISGQFAAIKTTGKWVDAMVVQAPAAMKLALGENPKCVYNERHETPVTRMATAAIIRENRADDIATAIRISKEFGLKCVIVHGTEAHLIPELLVQEGVPVITGPCLGDRSKPELANMTIESPAVLALHGVKTAICTDHPEVPVQHLALCAAMAVKGGMNPEAALAAITINPAQIAGIDNRVGSLTPGKDADIVITSGHPINLFSRVQTVLIGGQRIKG